MIRVGVVSPEPTPYRAPLFDRVAAVPGIDLTVMYAAQTVAEREWNVDLNHRAVFLRGPWLPTRGLLRHENPLTLEIVPLLERERFDCIIVAGWSLFASQTAIAWARLRRVPYLLMSESHLLDPRPLWLRALKRLLLPRLVRPAAGWLVTGSLAREAVIAYGADASRVRVVANTIDVSAHAQRVEELRRFERNDMRTSLGLDPDDVAVLSVGRLDRGKAVDVLIRAAAGVPRLQLVLVGGGPDEAEFRALAARLGVRAHFVGFLPPSDLPSFYAAADVFALLSRSETWGVVVVEAAASGLPLILSDRVGAARDLLRHGENGEVVGAGDVGSTGAALRRLAIDAAARARYGTRSLELASGWGYDPSVAALAEAVCAAVAQ